jgi:hypothetical protein
VRRNPELADEEDKDWSCDCDEEKSQLGILASCITAVPSKV